MTVTNKCNLCLQWIPKPPYYQVERFDLTEITRMYYHDSCYKRLANISEEV